MANHVKENKYVGRPIAPKTKGNPKRITRYEMYKSKVCRK